MPIVIRLYDPVSSEVRRAYSCQSVSWRLFKRAHALAKQFNSLGWVNLLEEHREAIGCLVVELFERQFSYDELMSGSTLIEMRTVVQAMLNGMREANSSTPSQDDEDQNPAGEDDGGWIIELETALIRAFGWSLRDIDETDVESMMPFINRFSKGTPVNESIAYCDQVSWL